MFKLIDRVSARGATLFMAQAVQLCAMPDGLTAILLFPVSTQARTGVPGMTPS